MQFEALGAVNMTTVVLQVVKLCGLVGLQQRLGGTHCPNLQAPT